MTACLPALRRILAGILVIAGLSLPVRAVAEEWVRTVSASGQIVAYAHTPLVSSELCALADRLKREWLRELDLSDRRGDPIILVAVTNQVAPNVKIFQTSSHLKYQIECTGQDSEELRATIIQTLCAELANREQPILRDKPYISAPIPLWLSRGLLLNSEDKEEKLLRVIRHSVCEGHPWGVAQLLAIEKLPAEKLTQETYLANVWLWTSALMELPEGTKKMRQFFQELGAQKSVSKAFDAVYHADFPTDLTREKWWGLILAEGTATVVAENFSAVTTSRRLKEIAAGPISKELLSTRLNELAALQILAHPSYRQVIAAYVKAFAAIRDDKPNRQRYLLEQARQLHARADAEAKAISDYLDKFDK